MLLPSADPGTFELLLKVLARASGADPENPPHADEVGVAQGPDDDQMVIYLIAKNLPAEALRHLREEALRFAAAVKDDSGQADDCGESTVA